MALDGRKKEGKALRSLAADLLCDLIGGLFYAMGVYTFAKMANFAPGGVTGLALIINHITGFPIGLATIALNIPLILISFRVVGKRFLLRTARSMLITTFFLDVIFPMFPMYGGSQLLAAIYSGICTGIGIAFFYMRGSSSGGTDFLIMSIKVRYPHISFGAVTMALDTLVILLGWPVYGKVDAVLFGLICSFGCSLVMDKILYGIGAGKLLVIITNRGVQVADMISEMSKRGSTILRALGSYTKAERDVLLCACSKSQAYQIVSDVHEIDPGAFVMVTETSEVFGEGFIEKNP